MSLIKPNETMSRLNPGYLTARNASLICSRVIAMSDNLLCHTRTAKLVGSCRAAVGSRGDMPGAGRAVCSNQRVARLVHFCNQRVKGPQIGRFVSFEIESCLIFWPAPFYVGVARIIRLLRDRRSNRVNKETG